MVLSTRASLPPNCISSVILTCRQTNDAQTTERATSAAIGRICVMHAMRPKIRCVPETSTFVICWITLSKIRLTEPLVFERTQQSHEKSSAFHKVVWWHFQVGWSGGLQFVFFWDNVNNQKYVWLILLKMTFCGFPRQTFFSAVLAKC